MTELAIQDNSYLSIIEKIASSPEVDVSKIEKLLDMQERIIDKQSEQAFNQALCNAQAEMPAIIKSTKNQQTNSTYAKLENINKLITPVYTKHGFSLSFDNGEVDENEWVRIVCKVSHTSGHSREYKYDSPIDKCGIKGTINKTDIHAYASATTYARRYLTCMIFNLVVEGEDNDGNQESSKKNLDASYASGVKRGIEIGKLWGTIKVIKDNIEVEDYYVACEAFEELTQEEKMAIWIAPSKGGPFTTDERNIMRSEEFRKEYFSQNKGEK